MEIKRPSFKHTEGLGEIYSRYDTLPLLRRLEAVFAFDESTVNSTNVNTEDGGIVEYMMDRVLRREVNVQVILPPAEMTTGMRS